MGHVLYFVQAEAAGSEGVYKTVLLCHKVGTGVASNVTMRGKGGRKLKNVGNLL